MTRARRAMESVLSQGEALIRLTGRGIDLIQLFNERDMDKTQANFAFGELIRRGAIPPGNPFHAHGRRGSLSICRTDHGSGARKQMQRKQHAVGLT